MPVTAEGSDAVLGVILVSVSTDTIVATMDVLEGKANIVEVILVFVIIILAVLVGTKMLRPFDRITKSIEDVTEGYDDNYLHEDTYTETHLISEAFNKMLGRQKVLNDSRAGICGERIS